MPQVPPWLVFATPTVAVLALLVAFASYLQARKSLALSRSTYERAGPKIRFADSRRRVRDSDGRLNKVHLVLKIWNQGLSDVSIDAMHVESENHSPTMGTINMISPLESAQKVSGPELPFALSAGSSVLWEYEDHWKAKHVFANLGNGAQIRATRMNGDVFPSGQFFEYGE